MKKLTRMFGIPQERCARCREVGDILARAGRLHLPKPIEEDDALKFECFESFAHLRASAIAGCDICRLLHCALALQAPSYPDLVHSASTVSIRLISPFTDEVSRYYGIIEVMCGGLRSYGVQASLWRPSQILRYFDPRRSWRDVIGKEFVGAAGDLELAKAWLNNCLTTHKECRQSRPTQLPKRLIDVGNADEPAWLVTGEDALARHSVGTFRYCALSYCWGQATATPRLTVRNVDAFMIRMPEELPKTIRDAITITRNLDVRYLWVDALCIVQPTENDQSEWVQEAARMGEIYSQAVCTISATGAKDSSEGCFVEHEWKDFSLETCIIKRHGVLTFWPIAVSISSSCLLEPHPRQLS